MQLVSIARAMVCSPGLLLADEPTGNVNPNVGRSIMDILRNSTKQQNTSVLMVTHNPEHAAWADRICFLKEGIIQSQHQQNGQVSVCKLYMKDFSTRYISSRALDKYPSIYIWPPVWPGKALRHHRLIIVATILGVATGMCVVCAILIVDQNTARTDNLHEQLTTTTTPHSDQPGEPARVASEPRIVQLPIKKVQIVKKNNEHATTLSTSNLPTQKLRTPVSTKVAPKPKGEEDIKPCDWPSDGIHVRFLYRFGHCVYTDALLRRHANTGIFPLLLCLGESQRNVALSLIVGIAVAWSFRNTGRIVGELSGCQIASGPGNLNNRKSACCRFFHSLRRNDCDDITQLAHCSARCDSASQKPLPCFPDLPGITTEICRG